MELQGIEPTSVIAIIGVLVGVIGVLIAFLAWRRPRQAKGRSPEPPALRLEQANELAYGKGAPKESVKAELRLANAGPGAAINWQLVIPSSEASPVDLARLSRQGPKKQGESIDWHQEGSSGPIPGGQHRDLDGWLWVEGPPGSVVQLAYEIRADRAEVILGSIEVVFASADGGPAIHIT